MMWTYTHYSTADVDVDSMIEDDHEQCSLNIYETHCKETEIESLVQFYIFFLYKYIHFIG